MAIVRDAVTVTVLPLDTRFALGYVDGRRTSGHYQRVKARLPHARIITVTTTGTTPAVLCDSETGDASPQTVAGGLHLGTFRAVYCTAARRASIQALVATPWPWWSVDWTGKRHRQPGTIGTQYESSTWDSSTVTDLWLLSVFPTYAATLSEEGRMIVAKATPKGDKIVVTQAVTTTGHLVLVSCPLAKLDTFHEVRYMDVTDAIKQQGHAELIFAP